MPWKAEFDTSLEELNVQHRYFLSLIEQLDSSTREHDRTAPQRMLLEITRYARFHFATEAALMEAYGFKSPDHGQDHHRILQQLDKFARADSLKPSSLRIFLYNWFASHTTLLDRELANYVCEARHAALGTVEQDDAREGSKSR